MTGVQTCALPISLFHETGHIFLAELQNAINAGAASEQMRADYAAILEWLNAGPGELTEQQHETFARGFEKYLMEGRPPNDSLKDAFYRFKKWLSSVYRSALNLNVEMPENIREVFDRLVTDEEQMKAAAYQSDIGLLTKEAMDSLRIPADDRDYLVRLYKAALNRAEQERSADKDRYKYALRKQWRKEAEREIAQDETYRASRSLKRLPMNREAARQAYGENALDMIPELVAEDGKQLPFPAA